MLRLLASLLLALLANAVGLIVCSLILEDFSINGIAFVTAVLIFTAATVLLDPLITKIAITNVPALRGGVALVTTLTGLIITSLITDGIQITGLTTWILATFIVWLFALFASLLLPLVLFKKTLEKAKE